MHQAFTAKAKSPVHIWLFSRDEFSRLAADPFQNARKIAAAQDFTARSGQKLLVPGEDGALAHIMFGLGGAQDALAVAGLSSGLPEGDYEIASAGGLPFEHIAAGWADGAYRFAKYLNDAAGLPRLLIPKDQNAQAISMEAEAAALVRDLVNTPASDMGPDAVEAVISALAGEHDAKLDVTRGQALLTDNFPLIHAVGRAAESEPRLCELSWGDKQHPELALVGKGVAFDSGGLNIKTGDGMRIMKKDMGGAAHVIGLAKLVMEARLPVRLKLYVPAVENAISGNAFRPGDILKSRKGLTIEIDNTDAEGRLILADALARACESGPDLLIDMATLTGAARVALGPDLVPLYSDDDDLAEALLEASRKSGDPVWRMPLWDPYLKDLASPVADMQNAGGRMAGSITAALFLKQFVDTAPWIHLDIWAWRLAKYGRQQGAAACGLRAVWTLLQARYSKP